MLIRLVYSFRNGCKASYICIFMKSVLTSMCYSSYIITYTHYEHQKQSVTYYSKPAQLRNKNLKFATKLDV
jgi:hypothetical protein